MAFAGVVQGWNAPTPEQTIYVSNSGQNQYKTTKQFSYADVKATLILPFILPGQTQPPMVELPGLTLISVSQHRDKYIVTKLGNSGPAGYTFGNRTVAGSFGFNIFTSSPWEQALAQYATYKGFKGDPGFMNPDELPPLDVSIIMVDDYGDTSSILIRGLTIVDTAQNISVDNISLSEVNSWMALKCTTLNGITKQTIGVSPAVNVPPVGGLNGGFNQKVAAPTSSQSSTSSSSTSSSTSSTSVTSTSNSSISSSVSTNSSTVSTNSSTISTNSSLTITDASSKTGDLSSSGTSPVTTNASTNTTPIGTTDHGITTSFTITTPPIGGGD